TRDLRARDLDRFRPELLHLPVELPGNALLERGLRQVSGEEHGDLRLLQYGDLAAQEFLALEAVGADADLEETDVLARRVEQVLHSLHANATIGDDGESAFPRLGRARRDADERKGHLFETRILCRPFCFLSHANFLS